MASIRKRRRADGGTSYQVRWILGGGAGRAGQTEVAETFTSRARALAFAAEVEEAGHQWPVNDAGIAWVKGEGYVAGTSPEPADAMAPRTRSFADVAESYFAHQARMVKLGHLTAYTLHRYERSYELHLSTTFGLLPFAEVALHAGRHSPMQHHLAVGARATAARSNTPTRSALEVRPQRVRPSPFPAASSRSSPVTGRLTSRRTDRGVVPVGTSTAHEVARPNRRVCAAGVPIGRLLQVSSLRRGHRWLRSCPEPEQPRGHARPQPRP